MNRRQALRNLGLGAGVLVVGPSTLSLLQSCKNDPQITWEPSFLNSGQGHSLERLLDVIIPSTDTPGAGDLNTAQFIDSYMNEVAPEDRQERFRRGAEAFSRSFKNELDKDPADGNREEYEQMVAKYLKASREDRDAYVKRLTETQDPMEQDPHPKDGDPDITVEDDAASTYGYLNEVRDLGIWAWKTSEDIGENVLWYDPIPGQYIACGPVEELSNNRAMSL